MRPALPAALFTLAATCAAGATTPATPVEVMSDPLRNPYQEFASSLPNGIGDNAVLFPAVTARTVITHVSCAFFLPAGGGLTDVYLSGAANNANNFLPAFAYTAQSAGTQYGVNADAYLFFSVGEAPRIDIFTTEQAPQSFDCTVTGYKL